MPNVQGHENNSAQLEGLSAALMEAAPDAIIAVSDDLTIVTANDATTRVFGYKKSELIGAPLARLVPMQQCHVHDQLAQEAFDDVRVADGLLMADYRKVSGRRADGTEFPVLVNLKRFEIDGTRYVIAIARDMTVMAEMGEQLQELSDQLYRRIDELEISGRARSQFFASISHELRTPLNAINGFAEVILSECFGKIGNDKYTEYLGDIQKSAVTMRELIDDLLDIERIESGKIDTRPEIFDLEREIFDIIRLILQQSKREQEKIRFTFEDAAKYIESDLKSFRKIITNILSNSDKYTPLDKSIEILCSVNDDLGIVVEISDEGVGIHEDDLERVFEPFTRGSHDAYLAKPGTGLGLPIVKQLTEINGIELQINSQAGKGTKVSLIFPCAASTSSVAAGTVPC